MAYVDIVTALAVLQFLVFGFKVARARGRYGVKDPAKREMGYALTLLPMAILVLGV